MDGVTTIAWSHGATSPINTRVPFQSSVRLNRKKAKSSRRQGSCENCRQSKVKCDGQRPACGHCMKSKKKNQKTPCRYEPSKRTVDKVIKKHRPSKSMAGTVREGSHASDDSTLSADSPPPSDTLPHTGPPTSHPHGEYFGPYGVARCIEQYKAATFFQRGRAPSSAVAECSGIDAFDLILPGGMTTETELEEHRKDHSLQYFLSEEELQSLRPDIQNIGWKAINIKDRMLDAGRVYEATFWLPYLVRAMHAFKVGRPVKTPRQNAAPVVVERKIERLIVELELRTKMHLGLAVESEIRKRLAASVKCPTTVKSDEALVQLETSKAAYISTALDALDILSELDSNDTVLTDQQDDSLNTIYEALASQQAEFVDVPGLADDVSVLVPVADHQIDQLSFMLMLTCLRASRKVSVADTTSTEAEMDDNKSEKLTTQRPASMHIDRILELSRSILRTFSVMTSTLGPSAPVNWTRSFAAFSTTAILLLAMINKDLDASEEDKSLIDQTTDHFRIAIREHGNQFCHLARERLEKLEAEYNRGHQSSTSTSVSRIKHEAISSSIHGSASRTASPDSSPRRKRVERPSSTPGSTRSKRRATSHNRSRPIPSTVLDFGEAPASSAPYIGSHQAYEPAMLGPVWSYREDVSAPTSANTSFNSTMSTEVSMPYAATGSMGTSSTPTPPQHLQQHLPEYPKFFHPPLTSGPPPMVDVQQWPLPLLSPDNDGILQPLDASSSLLPATTSSSMTDFGPGPKTPPSTQIPPQSLPPSTQYTGPLQWTTDPHNPQWQSAAYPTTRRHSDQLCSTHPLQRCYTQHDMTASIRQIPQHGTEFMTFGQQHQGLGPYLNMDPGEYRMMEYTAFDQDEMDWGYHGHRISTPVLS